jgi:hypothetical protein
MTAPTRTLPTVVRSRINRIAHAAAIRFEETTRQALTAELQRLALGGAGVEALSQHLDAHPLATGGTP